MGAGYTKFTEEHHAGTATGRPDVTPIVPQVKPDVPPPPKYNAPNFYAPKQSQLQQASYDPSSTSHQGIQRFGVPTHY